jgi:hypothetical protein
MTDCSCPIISGILWVAEKIAIPLGAAFAGVWFAFRNDRIKEEKDERDRQILAAHQMTFALMRQYQELLNLEDSLKEIESNNLLLTVLNPTCINTQELAFIARKHPAHLNDALQAEKQYLQVKDALAVYNHYTKKVQDFCRANAVAPGEGSSVIFKVNNESYPVLQIMRRESADTLDQFKRSVESGLKRNQDVKGKLRELFKELFEDEHFWTYSDPDEADTKHSR